MAVAPPEHVLALGILRRNRTSLANERSFVPIAIELDMKQGTCSARFARDVSGPNIEITSRMPMSEVLVELAQSGPISLAPQKGNQRSQRKENSEYFFHEVITEFCQRAENPLVLFDAVACREVLPWLADSKLDPKNVVIGNHVHAEADGATLELHGLELRTHQRFYSTSLQRVSAARRENSCSMTHRSGQMRNCSRLRTHTPMCFYPLEAYCVKGAF